MKKVVTLGLPKGRFLKKSEKIIETICGIKTKNNKLKYRGKAVRCHLLKCRDIPMLVSEGKLDIGVCPQEWILECSATLNQEFWEWGTLPWVKVFIALITSRREIPLEDTNMPIEIGTSYVSLSNQMIAELKHILQKKNIIIKELTGSIEATIPDLYTYGIDCVETGSTIKTNNLRVAGVLKTNLQVGIISKKFSKDWQEIINKIFHNEAY